MSRFVDEVLAGVFPLQLSTLQSVVCKQLLIADPVLPFEARIGAFIPMLISGKRAHAAHAPTQTSGGLWAFVWRALGYAEASPTRARTTLNTPWLAVFITVLVLIGTGMALLSWIFVQIEHDVHDSNDLSKELLLLDTTPLLSAPPSKASTSDSLTATELVRLNEPYLGVWNVSRAIKERALFWKGANLLDYFEGIDYDEIIDFYGTESMFSPQDPADLAPAHSVESTHQTTEPAPPIEATTGLHGPSNTAEHISAQQTVCDGPPPLPPSSPQSFHPVHHSATSPQPTRFPPELPQINSFKYSHTIAQMIEAYLGGDTSHPAVSLLPPVEDLKDLVRYGSNNLNAYLASNYPLTFPHYDKPPKFKVPHNITFLDYLPLFDNHDSTRFHTQDILLPVKTFRYLMSIRNLHNMFLKRLFDNVLFLYELVLDDAIPQEVRITIFKILADAFTDDSVLQVTVNFTYTVILALLKAATNAPPKSPEHQFAIISATRIANTLAVEDFNEFFLDDMYNHILSHFPLGTFDDFVLINSFRINNLLATFVEILKIDLLHRCKAMLDVQDYSGMVQFVKVIHDNLQHICNNYSFINAKSVELLFTWIWVKTKRNHIRPLAAQAALQRTNSMNANKSRLKTDENYGAFRAAKFPKSEPGATMPLANNTAVTNLRPPSVKADH